MEIHSHPVNSVRDPLHNKEQTWHTLYAIASIFNLNSLMFSLEYLMISIPSAPPRFGWVFCCFALGFFFVVVLFSFVFLGGVGFFLIIINIVYGRKATEKVKENEAAL